MFFRNAKFYTFTEDFNYDAEQLADKLATGEFQACSKHSEKSIGWHPVFGKEGVLTYATEGYILFALAVEEKILPASVVNEHFNARLEELEDKEARKYKKQERENLKDDVRQTLLLQAFSKSKKIFGYIDTNKQVLIIDTASKTQADTFIAYLRKAIGSLPIAMPKLADPATVMTSWLKTSDYPVQFTILDQCTIKSSTDNEASTIKCKGHDPLAENVQAFIEEGCYASELFLNFRDQINFTLTDEALIKGIKFLDVLKEANADFAAETQAERLAADFIIMAAALSDLITYLQENLATENESKLDVMLEDANVGE